MGPKKMIFLMICLTLGALSLAACGAPAATIKTPSGSLVIKDVQFTDSFPPGCSTEPLPLGGCTQAKEGYQVLIVWLERTDGGDPTAIADEIQSRILETYVIAGDGFQKNGFAGGLLPSGLAVAFIVPASAQDFKLFWPDNPAIDLEK
jgi:hypothetical protein